MTRHRYTLIEEQPRWQIRQCHTCGSLPFQFVVMGPSLVWQIQGFHESGLSAHVAAERWARERGTA